MSPDSGEGGFGAKSQGNTRCREREDRSLHPSPQLARIVAGGEVRDGRSGKKKGRKKQKKVGMQKGGGEKKPELHTVQRMSGDH